MPNLLPLTVIPEVDWDHAALAVALAVVLTAEEVLAVELADELADQTSHVSAAEVVVLDLAEVLVVLLVAALGLLDVVLLYDLGSHSFQPSVLEDLLAVEEVVLDFAVVDVAALDLLDVVVLLDLRDVLDQTPHSSAEEVLFELVATAGVGFPGYMSVQKTGQPHGSTYTLGCRKMS